MRLLYICIKQWQNNTWLGLFFFILEIKRIKKKNTKTELLVEENNIQFHMHQNTFCLLQMRWRGGLLTVSKTLSNKRLFNLAKQVSRSSRSWSQKFKLNMWQILSVGRWLTIETNCQEKQVIFPSHEVVKLELNNSQEIIWLLPRTNYWSQYIVN